jgi:hypothetical protein
MIRLVWAKAEIGLKKTFVIFIICACSLCIWCLIRFQAEIQVHAVCPNVVLVNLILQTDMYIFFQIMLFQLDMIRLVWAKAEIGLKKPFVIFIICACSLCIWCLIRFTCFKFQKWSLMHFHFSRKKSHFVRQKK